MAFIIPAIFIIVLGCAAIKKVNVYSCFTSGIESALKFVLSLLPCLAAVFMMCALFEESGLSELMIKLTSPAFSFFGVPEELTKLILIKPLSGSGSLAYLTEILNEYGADSYIARCACVCYGSSETVFYISAVYFAGMKTKGLMKPIIISLFSALVATVLACALCQIV
ncbi:MAG TPA: hypothetical protein IAB90_00810 [Candidatus Coproplasma stercoripullorum]|uniref:Nucleoside transporter/FeoB GTPase Gate domain-containing protein n=1 Tax=Candidatus Coproplasma stercoripullorum TaxID=2840751 RepID=A0A9D1AEC6_9FIRM|nr:hypothetical protein [Candidatus Coproplasma stercoripullorum]